MYFGTIAEYNREVEYPSAFWSELVSNVIKNPYIFFDFLFQFVYTIFECKFVI